MIDDTKALAQSQQAKTDAELFLGWLLPLLPDAAYVAQLPKAEIAARSQWAADTRKQIAQQRAVLEDQRKFLKAPALEAGRRIDAMFMPPIKLWEQAEGLLKGFIKICLDVERQRQTAALASVQNQAEVAQAVALMAPAPTGIAERTEYWGEVIDETQLPREFWIVDQAKIDRVIRGAKGNVSIPGVRVVVDTRVVGQG